MSVSLQQAIRQTLHNAQRILLLSHIRPDGDAFGSILGLGLSLQKIGKDVQMVVKDGASERFKFLPGSSQIRRKVTGSFDISVVLDASDIRRTGEVLENHLYDINIDHHITNENFARLNFVDPQACATSEILAEYLPIWDLPINKDVATALLTGIIVDTIGFRTSNMRPKTLLLSARLMEYGANLPELYHLGLVQRSVSAVRYWGAGLSNIQVEDKLLWTTLTLSDREKASYPLNDDADLVNLLTTIENIDIALLFVEQKKGSVKISWRAQPGFDVSQLAVKYGGGGHPAAAGADIVGDLSEVQQNVIEATKEFIKTSFIAGSKNSHTSLT
jgi:bifunctional oligoribonuclease and PAP phosphatase NrnA